MNTLLIFFALPIAVIIISAILQKLLQSPLAVSALIFAIFLVVTFAAFDETFLIATLVYTILAFITATLVRLFCRTNENNCICETLTNLLNNSNNDNNSNNNNENGIDNINNTLDEILRSVNNLNSTNNNTGSCGCNRYRRF